jgi:hypothetical protein
MLDAKPYIRGSAETSDAGSNRHQNHCRNAKPMSHMGQSRRFDHVLMTSGLRLQTDIIKAARLVRSVPEVEEVTVSAGGVETRPRAEKNLM